MYITTDDFDTAIYPEVRRAISRNSQIFMDDKINIALSIAQSKLALKYDMATELEKTGNQRNHLLLGIIKDIAIYYLYETQETVPDHRAKRYDDAIDFLNDFKTGKSVLVGVPMATITTTTNNNGTMTFGSEPKRNNRL